MKSEIISTTVTHSAGRVRLAGQVAGVESCELVADADEIMVGSGIDCDLVVPDPLIPAHAFLLRHVKSHGGTDCPCCCHWILKASPNARIYVNNTLSDDELLAYGDTISAGCHQLVFSKAENIKRNLRANVNVGDLCAGLLKESVPPPGFLRGSPERLYRFRINRAWCWAGALGLMALLVFIVTPRREFFEPIQPPLDVVMLAEEIRLPNPENIKSLKDINRQQIPMPAVQDHKPELTGKPNAAEETMTLKPEIMNTPPVELKPAVPERVVTDIGSLKPFELVTPSPEKMTAVTREPGRLAESAPRRRLTLAEAALPREMVGLAGFSAKASEKLPATAKQPMTQDLQKNIQAPDYKNVALDKAKTAALLAAFQPSPVKFETVGKYQIPVVRITEQLNKLEIKGSEGIQLDGKVTTAETALAWKTGRLRMHAPGNPPPEGKPATYCYVGKTDYQGRPHLYVAFVCMDDNLDKLVFQEKIFNGDSIEIFLDINSDRKDFHQLLVDPHGRCVTYYVPEPSNTHVHYPWAVNPVVKTTINKDAGQWTSEVLVPFEQLGGVPAKGTRWYVNFTRNYRGQSQPWQVQSWFQIYTGKLDYYVPSLFGVFEW